MATLYIDTEFNSYRGQLISMALVLDEKTHWYAALHCASPHPWVAAHVMPVLEVPPVGLNAFQRSLQTFLAQFGAVHIVADWPEDIQHFCWALITGPGERLATPPITLEIRRDLSSAKAVTPHNALSDALAIHAMATGT